MNAGELAEIVENLRVLGGDVADVEVKKAQGVSRAVCVTSCPRSRTHTVESSFSAWMRPTGSPQPVLRNQRRWLPTSVGPETLDEHLVAAMMLRLRSSRPYAYRELSSQEILRRIKVTVADETKAGDVVSLGGLLALGSYPQEHFPQLMLTFVHYPSERGSDEDTGVRFLDSVAIEGPIPVGA